MKYKILVNMPFAKKYAICFEKGESVVEQLEKFIQFEKINFATFEGIGAFEETEIGLFENGEYKRFFKKELVEVISFSGNITFLNNKSLIHAHTTLSFDGKPSSNTNDFKNITVVAGHFFCAKVGVTLELILTTFPFSGRINRKFDPKSKLNTWDI